jgi:hypothetical protein
MDARDDIIESARPPRPPKGHDPGLGTSVLRQAVAVAAVGAVATAAFTGITAWETHQERVNTKLFYCTFAAEPGPNPAPDSRAEELSEQLDC